MCIVTNTLDKGRREFMRRFEQLKAQYNAIMRNNTQYDYSELCVSAITSDFDRIFELAWKTLKEYLWKELGVAGAKSGSPREILGLAFQYCLINKEELWIAMLQDRNDDAHIYSKTQAILYKSRIEEQYLPVVGELIDELAEQIPNGEAISNVEIPKEKNIPKEIEAGLIELAKKYNLSELILFGSRARGDHWERSDIDLAIKGCVSPTVFFAFSDEVWKLPTLLMFDFVNLDSDLIGQELRSDIAKEGIVLWRKEKIL